MLERCNNRSKLPENGDILLLAHQLFKADKTSKAATSKKANMKTLCKQLLARKDRSKHSKQECMHIYKSVTAMPHG